MKKTKPKQDSRTFSKFTCISRLPKKIKAKFLKPNFSQHRPFLIVYYYLSLMHFLLPFSCNNNFKF